MPTCRDQCPQPPGLNIYARSPARTIPSSAATNVRHVWVRVSSCPGRACRSETGHLLAELPQPSRCRVVAGGLGGLTPLAFDVVTARLSGYLGGRGQVHDGVGATLR